jgi:hypothetical protein
LLPSKVKLVLDDAVPYSVDKALKAPAAVNDVGAAKLFEYSRSSMYNTAALLVLLSAKKPKPAILASADQVPDFAQPPLGEIFTPSTQRSQDCELSELLPLR